MSTTLTPYLDAPTPRVEIFISGLGSSTASVTVYRLAKGREFTVRGAVNAPVAGSLSRIDFEVPFNTEVTYRAERFNAAGLSLGFTTPATITVPSPDTWLHNPLDPHGAVRVTLIDTAARALSRPVPGEVSYPAGRRVGVVLSEPRQGLRGAVFDVYTDTVEDADRVQAMLGDYSRDQVPVICVRLGSGAPSHSRVTSPLFLGVLDITEEPLYSDVFDGAVQRITGDEVSPPAPGLFIPLLTAADINAYYTTADEANNDNLTAMDLNRRYDLAGYANS